MSGMVVVEITVWEESKIPAVLSQIENLPDVLSVERVDI
jgi:acetolactate synthase regulatory subunit